MDTAIASILLTQMVAGSGGEVPTQRQIPALRRTVTEHGGWDPDSRAVKAAVNARMKVLIEMRSSETIQ